MPWTTAVRLSCKLRAAEVVVAVCLAGRAFGGCDRAETLRVTAAVGVVGCKVVRVTEYKRGWRFSGGEVGWERGSVVSGGRMVEKSAGFGVELMMVL